MGFLDRLRNRTPTTTRLTAAPGHAAAPHGGWAVIDVETTGLSANAHRILELAIVRIDVNGQPAGEWTCRFNPDGPVGATHIHGITAADVAGAPRFAQVLPEISARLQGAAIVGHNARFDLAFLRAEYARAGWALPFLPSLCTLDASITYLPHLERRRLVDCCAASGIALHQAHSALGDARATATLLRSYLDPQFGRPPQREHLELPGQAWLVAWPTQPGGVSAPRSDLHPRALRNMAQPKITAPALTSLVQRFSLAEALDDGAPDGTLPYLELLADALEDGVLTDEERAALVDLAGMYDLGADTIALAHRSFLLALAHLALDDGKVSRAERSELHHLCELLAVPSNHVNSVLDAAEAARHERLSAGLKALPENWTLGEPLRVGDKVVFTGCDEQQRESLERRADELGVRVMSSVNARTAMLVTDGGFAGGKAADAAALGTRTVTPEQFATLLQHLQPAKPPKPVVPAQRQQPSAAPTPTAPRSTTSGAAGALADVSPAAVRAWANAHGYTVGVRGRLPAEVLDAYRQAHASTTTDTAPTSP